MSSGRFDNSSQLASVILACVPSVKQDSVTSEDVDAVLHILKGASLEQVCVVWGGIRDLMQALERSREISKANSWKESFGPITWFQTVNSLAILDVAYQSKIAIVEVGRNEGSFADTKYYYIPVPENTTPAFVFGLKAFVVYNDPSEWNDPGTTVETLLLEDRAMYREVISKHSN